MAQTSGPEAQISRGIGLGFRQEFNSYQWRAGAALDHSIVPGLHFSIQENLRTSLLRTASEGDRWKDDQNLDVQLTYRLFPSLAATLRAASILFLDKQSGFNNNVRSHSGTAGFTWSPLPKLNLAARLGPKWDSRFNQNDRGLTFSVDASAAQIDMGGYDNSLAFALGEDQYDRRKNSTLVARYNVSRNFTKNAADSLNLYLSNQRRDNYVSQQGEIESQREHIKGARNVLFYDVGQGITTSLTSELTFKNVELLQYGESQDERRRKRNDQRLANDLTLRLIRKSWSGRFDLSSWLQQQRYDLTIKSDRPFSARTAFVTPDNSSSRLFMSGFIAANVSDRDSVTTFGSISRFQYDTPDTSNYDDRDEIRINTRATWSHRFGRSLQLNVLAGVNLYHMVYIFGERSADNNWNRIFILRPAVEYSPGKHLRLYQQFEVLANYVDYDFENPEVQTKSFVFRKFAMTDSLFWQLGSQTALQVDYRLQLEENGQLYWDQWAEKVIVDRVKQWVHAYWRYSTHYGFQISPGYTAYFRDEWRHKDVGAGTQRREKSSTYLSHGPKLRLLYAPGPKAYVIVDATRYKIETADDRDSFVNNIELEVRWLF